MYLLELASINTFCLYIVLLTPEEITLAYRLLLGREPENAEVITNLSQTTHSIEQLRTVFMQTPEFRERMGQLLDKPQVVSHRHPFHLPSIPVEINTSADQLAQMFERIHQEWEHLGKTDPYWSVLTQPHFHLNEFEAHRQEFYSSGKSFCDLFLAGLRRNHFNYNNAQTCLEIGCGVGRVTSYLAEVFPKVIAADISKNHLNHAQQHLADKHISNVDFKHLHNITLFESLGSVDTILSMITFQHNPPPVSAWILRSLLNALNPNGIAFLQFLCYRSGYLFEVERYLHSQQTHTLEMHVLPQHDIFKIIAECHCVCLEVRENGMVGDENLMLSNTFIIQKKA